MGLSGDEGKRGVRETRLILFAVQIEDWKHLSFPVPVDEEEREREREREEAQDAD